MENLNNVPSTGTFGNSVQKINSNFDLIVNAINSLEYQTTRSKGILNYGQNPATVFPNAVAGDWCMILSQGNVFPATIKTYNGSTWSGSGTWNPDGVDLTQYAQKSEMTTAIANSLAQATARMGYGECTVSGTALTVSIPNFILPTSGGTIHIKMSAVGTGASTLSINGTTAKTLWYNGAAVSSENTWEANEIISVFYDGSRFMASNSQGGGGDASKIKYNNSRSLLDSDNVKEALDELSKETALFEDSTEDDLFISDRYGNVLVQFSGGHIKVKNFDSEKTPKYIDYSNGDYGVCDDNGNVLVQFSGGHIKVKNFDSEKTPKYIDYSNGDYGVCDDNGNVLVQFSGGHIKIKNFDSRNISPSYLGSYWKNKKIAFLGDSITQQAKYIDAYVNLTGCIALNYGVSGEHLAKISGSLNKDFESRVPSMDSDVDMVIVFGGTNDFGHTNTAAPFGELGDGPKDNYFTFCAGVHRLFKSLYEKYKGKPVVVMTPVHHGVEIDQPEYTQPNGTSITTFDNSFIEHPQVTTGKTFREYVDMIKIIAQFYSFVVIDAYSFSGLNPIMEIGSSNRYYFSDGLHLSTLGGNKLAQWMYPHLERVYKMFY